MSEARIDEAPGTRKINKCVYGKLYYSRTNRIVQIRIGGAKGVQTIDPTLLGR